MDDLDALQWSYRDLVFGAGTDYHLNRAEGFEGFEARVSDSDQPRGDGAIRGLDYAAPRTVALELALIETADLDGSVYEGFWSEVRRAFRISREADAPLFFARPGMPQRFIRCRPIQLTRNEEYLRFNRVGQAPVVLRAVDPRIYSAELHLATVPIYSTDGGVDLPTDLSLDFGGGSQIESVLQNDGTAEAYPLVRFYGPATGTVTGVVLTNTTTGQVLDISATVLGGQILTADMEALATGANRQIISLDGAGRYGDWALPREPFALAPGTNTLRFEVVGSSPDAVCNVAWRDTSLE